MEENSLTLIGFCRFCPKLIIIVSLLPVQQLFYSTVNLLLSRHTMILMEKFAIFSIFYEQIKTDLSSLSVLHLFPERNFQLPVSLIPIFQNLNELVVFIFELVKLELV